MKFIVLANCISKPGTLGGNSRIFLEFSKHFVNFYDIEFNIITTQHGKVTCLNYLGENKKINYHIINIRDILNVSRAISHPVCLVQTMRLLKRNKSLFSGKFVLYSISNNFPDVIPAYFLKRKSDKFFWVATNFLPMPNPLKGIENYHKKYYLPKFDVRAILSYFVEKTSNVFIKKKCDSLFITNDYDRVFFENMDKSKILAIYGGVDNRLPDQVDNQKVRYDACFVGRLHQQKGVLDLIKIWSFVVKDKPDAKVAIIGNGPRFYLKKIHNLIAKLGLKNNVVFHGFLDGTEKYKILKSAKVFLHTTVYDNFGMAAVEAMAAGLPIILYDIKALQNVFPSEMPRIKFGQYEEFSRMILQLLNDNEYYNELSDISKKTATTVWDWHIRSELIYDFIKRNFNIFIRKLNSNNNP